MEEIKVDPTVASNKDTSGTPVVKPLDGAPASNNSLYSKQALVVYVIMAASGLALGSGVFALKNRGAARFGGREVQVIKTGTEEGVKDSSNFKDTATGKLIANDGKITDEGTHILIRGEASQNVFLTSSVVDLSKYENKNVQVWGETYKGQKAGWLLDVGLIKLLN